MLVIRIFVTNNSTGLENGSSLFPFSTLIRMAYCPMVLATILVVGVCSQSDCSTTSWLKISNRILVSVPYGNFRLDIYEQVDNNKLKTDDKCYFYSPIAQLDGKSATTSFDNEVAKQNEMRFRIEMWNDKVQSRVVQYLAELFRRQVTADRVRVVPFDKVALASTAEQTLYKLSADWLPYQQSMWFSVTCLLQKDCDQLVNDMRTHPDQFDNLKLVYSPTSQTSQTFGTAPRHDIHFVQDSAPTADDWIELTAKNSDLKEELNEMKSAVGILQKELNEFKGTFNGSKNQNQNVFEIPRRSTDESLMRLAETKITVAGDLRKEVAAALQTFVETTAALTRELNETKATIANLRKELTETKNRSMETTRRLAQMMRAELNASNESSERYRITERLPTFNCKGKTDGNYGDPSSKCSSRFYICAHGNVFQRSCPAGTVYRANTLQCDWSYNVPGCE